MVVCVCRSKIRKNNAIEAYLLEDSNGATKTIKADKLKRLIRSGDVYVLNLNLSSDNRLISTVNQNKHARCCMFEICKKLRFKFSGYNKNVLVDTEQAKVADLPIGVPGIKAMTSIAMLGSMLYN